MLRMFFSLFAVLCLLLVGVRLWIGGRPTIRGATKRERATSIIRASLGRHGIWADPSRYRGQLWTRDLSLAMQPAAAEVPGGLGTAGDHLRALAQAQRPNGRIPIVMLDGARGTAAFLWDKIGNTISRRKVSFMLRRWASGNLWDLTPGTRDSELHFVRAVQMHESLGGPPLARQGDMAAATERALDRIEVALLDTHGLMLGADWRDTMDEELGRQPLLSNNALLYGVFKRAHRTVAARRIREGLETRAGGLLADYPGADRPDPLGIAFAVLEGLVSPARYPEALSLLRQVDTPRGVTILCKHNPQNGEERAVIERTQGVVVWPFVVGYVILAAQTMGPEGQAFADEQRAKLEALDGFYEWYDPATGTGYGAPLQGWSAALYLRVSAGR